jgi:hypothetical protein
MSFLKDLENQLREEQRTNAVALFQENKKKIRYTRSGRVFTEEERIFHECLAFTARGLKAGTIKIFNPQIQGDPTSRSNMLKFHNTQKKVSSATFGFMKNLEGQLHTENYLQTLENQLRAEARP